MSFDDVFLVPDGYNGIDGIPGYRQWSLPVQACFLLKCGELAIVLLQLLRVHVS